MLAFGTWVSPTVRLVRHLGDGAMGSVWVGHHMRLDVQVAVKFMSQAISSSPELRARFEREARAAAKIASPHVVDILDHGEMADGTPFIVMELLDGESLATLLARYHHLSLRQSAIIVAQVAKALHAAHAGGEPVVHRDIKPDNIFITGVEDNDIFVKVLDFGVAKYEPEQDHRLTGVGSMMGTFEYMSPELLLSSASADHRVDLWALSVVAYEMLTGTLPFNGDTTPQLIEAIMGEQPRPPSTRNPDVPGQIDRWFEKALARDSLQRFASARELSAELWRAIDESQRSLIPSGEYRRISVRAEWNAAEWYVRAAQRDSVVGPVSLELVYRGIKGGRVPPDAEIRREGSSDWDLASVVIVSHARDDAEGDAPAERPRDGSAPRLVPPTILQTPTCDVPQPEPGEPPLPPDTLRMQIPEAEPSNPESTVRIDRRDD